jgi:microcystin-dependent protein
MATPNLALPEIAEGQTNKHITHNTALGYLDGALTAPATITIGSAGTATIATATFQRSRTLVLTPDATPPTGTVTITVPAIARGDFYVLNNTAQAADIKTAAQSGTLPRVPAGELRLLHLNNATVRLAGGGGGVGEAPEDGQVYGRQNKAWVPVTTGDGSGGTGGSSTVSPQHKGARVRPSANLAVAANVSAVFNPGASAAEDYDTNGFWGSAAPSRLVIPAGVTKIKLRFKAQISSGTDGAVTGGTAYEAFFRKNGSDGGFAGNDFVRAEWETWPDVDLSSDVLTVAEGDYFEVILFGTAAFTMRANGRTWFAIEVVEGGVLNQSVSGGGGSATVGTVAIFPRNAAPDGWLKANGAALSRTTYAALWAEAQASGNLAASEGAKQVGQYGPGDGSTTFTLPDLRGQFMRAWDDGKGIDSGRAIGSAQAHATEDLFAKFKMASPAMSSRIPTPEWGASHTITTTGLAAASSAETLGTAVAPMGTGETRPRNVALLVCIKY